MKVKEYDVVVSGGGSAGCSAAKTLAEKGAEVIILEEHPNIGIPRHCPGTLIDAGYTVEEMLGLVGEQLVIQREKLFRVIGPGGEVVREDPGRGRVVIRREEFDQQWARLAANAGAKIALSTRVTGLLKKNGRIIGVTTNSRSLPEVHCKLVIAAGGYGDLRTGITKQEGLLRTDVNWDWINGIVMELTNVKGLEPGVWEEFYLGSATRSKGLNQNYRLNPVDSTTSWMVVESLAAFRELQAGDHVLGKKLRDAVLLQMHGYMGSFPMGIGAAKHISDGLIVVGQAGVSWGMIPAVVTGRYAAEVVAEAIKDGDVSEAKLSKYETLVKDLGYADTRDRGASFTLKALRAPDEELTELLKEKP